MALATTYNAGTASVNAAETGVTGQGTTWLTSGLQAGDMFWAAGLTVRIASVNSNTSLTLASPWPGASRAAAAYEAQFTPDAVRVLASARAVLDALTNGALYAFSALVGAANKLAYFTGAGTMSLTDLTAYARSLLGASDANAAKATLGLAALNSTAAGNIGVGTANPVEDFEVRRDRLGITSARIINNTSGTGVQSRITLATGTANSYAIVALTDNNGAPNLQISGGSAVQRLFMDMAAFTFRGITGAQWMNIANGAVTITGSLSVSGSLAKGSGTFLIDHPLDPLNRDLAHGFVEAPRYDLIYRGTAVLVDGRATVDIDAASNMSAGTFAALVTNACVTSLQNQTGFARLKPGPITGASFEIICEDDNSADTIAWVVIAERNDAFVRSSLDPNTDADGRFMCEREKEAA